MKILLILASPRKEKSQTFILAKEVLKGLPDSVQTEVIQLCDYNIKFCLHCEACHKKIMQCPLKDDVNLILEKILKADGIIFATPNYINQVTASLKALWDRASHFIHCQRLLGKYIAAIVTSGSGYDKPVLDYIQYYANTCGAFYSGGVSSQALGIKDKMSAALNLGNKLISDIQVKQEDLEQKKVIEAFKQHFKQVMLIRKDDWAEEYKYWVNKGWIN